VNFVGAAAVGGAAAFLSKYGAEFDVVWVSRPHNFRALRNALPLDRTLYDAEALFATRDLLRARLRGTETASAEGALEEELSLGKAACAVTCVTEAEAAQFRLKGATALVVSHAVTGVSQPLEARRGVVWVGPLRPGTPNADALQWYVDAVRPLIRLADGLTIVGDNVARIDPPGATALGVLNEGRLSSVLARMRCMIVPMRWAAGLPLKAVHGMAHGLPLITSRLAAAQLELPEDALVADDPREFAAHVACVLTDDSLWQREHARSIEIAARRFSVDTFRQSVAAALAMVVG
jgi:glycosyltransferase involved in cell wall biosynthesis